MNKGYIEGMDKSTYPEVVRALVVPTDASPYTTLVPQTAGQVIRAVVGGHFDCIRQAVHLLNNEAFHGYVHDEGLLIGLPLNPVATAMFGRILAGNVIVFGSFNAQFEYDGYEHAVDPLTVSRARGLWEIMEIYNTHKQHQ